MDETTSGSLLGGRVGYRQLRSGHRTGFEPVLLAAHIAAQPGQSVLESGTGAGAALLCLAERVAGVIGVGIELDSELAQLAAKNFHANGRENLHAVQANVQNLPFAVEKFDHVMANPPWFAAAGTPSPDERRALAHRAGPDLLQLWIASLTSVLRPRGSLTLILPAASYAAAACALRAQKFGAIALYPLWPRAGLPAKMVICAAIKGAKSPDTLLPGLVLHDEHGITAAAQKILGPENQSTSGVSNTA
jgi:tRNA1(Val) A37 N6-methylase TrmN6